MKKAKTLKRLKNNTGKRTIKAGEVLKMPRDVYRVLAEMSHLVTTSVTHKVLHTADVQKTLVRMIIRGSLRNATTSAELYKCRLMLVPEDFSVPTITSAGSESLDNDISDPIILVDKFEVESDGTASHKTQRVEIDLHMMRKMELGDELQWSDICQTANGIKNELMVTMFFKDA